MDKSHGRVVDMLLNQEVLEPSPRHVVAVTSHLTQSNIHNLGNVCLAVSTALKNRRPKVGLWLLKQRIRAIEQAGNYTMFIEIILITAVSRGEEAIVDFLLKHSSVDVNILDIQGKSALILAGELGHQGIVKRLLEHPGVEINIKDVDGFTGLIWAADNGHVEAVTEFLKAPEIDVNAVDLDGHSALTRAADRGHTQIVSLLLDHSNLEVNVRDLEGFSPLICAANQGHREVVKLLLADTRTDVNLTVEILERLAFFHYCLFAHQDNDGWTALLSAVKSSNRNRDPSKKEDFEEIVRSLLEHPMK